MESTIHPLTVEQLLYIIGVLIIPIISGAVWLAGKLTAVESQIRSLKELKCVEHETIIQRVERVEKNMHDMRNLLQTMTLAMIRSGIHVDSDHHNSSN
jgi:hypothetical protein